MKVLCRIALTLTLGFSAIGWLNAQTATTSIRSNIVTVTCRAGGPFKPSFGLSGVKSGCHCLEEPKGLASDTWDGFTQLNRASPQVPAATPPDISHLSPARA